VHGWSGEPHGKEGQQLSWQDPAALTVSPMLPANTPVLAALGLPPVYAISHWQEMGGQAFFAALDAALLQGLRLVQVREKQLGRDDLAQFTKRVIARCRPYGARVLVNGDVDLARACGADGVHLPETALMQLAERPQGMLAGASCHGIDALQHAVALDLDFVVLSPVLPTRSHPEAAPLGWERFAALIADCPLPVYALGGMQPAHLETAWRHGAHGIAMQRAVWGS
ncbi:MAG: Nudix family hydrolase, partial [Methylobacterium sp.]|nr:Nudix family hydrolase [Methylobacterium sp.]